MTSINTLSHDGFCVTREYFFTGLSRPYTGKLRKNRIQPVKGDTSLHQAVRYGNIKEVQNILGEQVDLVESENDKGETPLHVAIPSGNIELCKLLLKAGAEPGIRYPEGSTGLLLAIEAGHLELVNLLLFHGAGANAVHAFKTYSPLEAAVIAGQLEIVESLLQHGAEARARASATLHMAVNKGDIDIARLLLQHKADPSSQLNCTYYRCKSPLHIAIRKGFVDLTELLLEYSADPNTKDYKQITPLHLAAQIGSAHVAGMLINAGARIDTKDFANQTPLHASVNNVECFKLLLSYGADVNSGDNYQGSPLHIYAEAHSKLDENCHKFVSLVSMYGGDINMRCGPSKETAFSIACRKGAIRLIAALLDHDCDVNMEIDLKDLPYDITTNKCFISYLIKLNAAKIDLSPQNVIAIQNSSAVLNTLEFQKECEKEIAHMKMEKIQSTNISYFDILTKSLYTLVRYAQNEDVVNVVGLGNWKEHFPIYSNMIIRNYKRGERRKKLLLSTEINLGNLLIGFEVLPHFCKDKILDYLNDRDLVVFLIAIYSKVDLDQD